MQTNRIEGSCRAGIEAATPVVQRTRRVRSTRWTAFLSCVATTALSLGAHVASADQSVARQWNEQMLSAIRRDLARPTVHARNLFHVSMAMYDAWAVYDPIADTFLIQEHATAPDIAAARNETISFAA